MAKMTSDQLIEAFKELTLIELSEFVKKFEETFEVTAAAPCQTFDRYESKCPGGCGCVPGQ